MRWLDRAKRALRSGSAILAHVAAGAKSAAPRRVWAFEPLEPRLPLSGAPGLVPVGTQPTGTLTGKIVYTSAGHGWQWNSTLGRWATDRGNLLSMVEDFGNQDQLTYYADYLLRAGATVVPMRPVGRQTNEVVLDNDSPGVTFTGSWTNNTTGPRWYDEDYGVGGADAVKYRFANVNSSSETAVATYTPNIPQAGFYPVYTWVSHGSNRTDQLYKINHTGGQTQITVDHRMVGNGWVYLGTYHFNAGSSTTEGSVQISNHSTGGGSVVIADAIRFGNGMGDVPWGSSGIGTGNVSGYPREDEGSLLWLWRAVGQSTTFSSPSSVIGTSNVSAPSLMAEHMNANTNPFGTSVYIGFHSNATTGNPSTATARGAIGLMTTDPSLRTPNQQSLATFTGRQINVDLRALDGQFEHNWSTRTSYVGSNINFGEIRKERFTNSNGVIEMDGTIVEVAFHDNTLDAQLMRDPRVRDQIARSTYEATLEYFRLVSTPQPANITLPSPPTNVRAVTGDSGEVTVSWAAGPVGGGVAGVHGNAATGFRIYASTDGYGFDGGTFVAGGGTTSVTLSGYDPTLPYYFKVVAENAGGQSRASEVLTVLPSGGAKQVLIVNGFDRHDRDQNFKLPYAFGGTNTDRVWASYNNSFDYVVQVHSAIHAARPGIHVASTSNEAVISGAVNLNDYHTVIWISGTEGGGSLTGPANRTFDATEQTKISQFIAAGGNLFVTGSDIAFDLDSQNNGRSFYRNTLGSTYAANSAGTYTATAAAGGIFAGLANVVFSNGAAFSSLDSQLYNVNSADVLTPQAGAVVALNYNNGSGAAAIQKQGTGGQGSVVVFGFPFEAITNVTRRTQVMGRVLDFFGVDVIVPANPAIQIKKSINGEDADTAPGPTLAAGSTATFTYVVTNTGDIALTGVTIIDDNGTPGNAADDFSPIFVGGDSNGNGLLDVDETWTYTASHLVVAGPFTSSGKASGEAADQSVMSSDTIHYFGSAPAIAIKVYVEGDDADLPPGPDFNVGSSVTLAYLVTNTGNTALSEVVVVDDNGTPLFTTDDFQPTFATGDVNGNGLLDVGETWVYTSVVTASQGQNTHTAAVIGQDGIGQFVWSTDLANYNGLLPPPNADFNNDGMVDAADYLIWRRNLGTNVPAGTLGDADHNGLVDELDYDIWRAQFGTSPATGGGGSAAQVAELIAEPATNDDASQTAAQDAVFSRLSTSSNELRTWRRPAEVRERVTVRLEPLDRSLLLTKLAEIKAEREQADPERRWTPQADDNAGWPPQNQRSLLPRLAKQLAAAQKP